MPVFSIYWIIHRYGDLYEFALLPPPLCSGGGGERFCLRIAPSRLSHPFNSARHFPVTRRPRVHTTSVDPNQAS